MPTAPAVTRHRRVESDRRCRRREVIPCRASPTPPCRGPGAGRRQSRQPGSARSRATMPERRRTRGKSARREDSAWTWRDYHTVFRRAFEMTKRLVGTVRIATRELVRQPVEQPLLHPLCVATMVEVARRHVPVKDVPVHASATACLAEFAYELEQLPAGSRASSVFEDE